jgi:hypothetical protein
VEPKLRVRSSGYGGSGYKHPLNGDVVPGVTTVLKKLDKPGVLQWAVDNTAAYAVANIDALMSRTEEQGYGFLRWYWKRDPLQSDDQDIRNYSNGVLRDAADLGTLMHDWVAADHGAQPYPDVTFAPDYFWQMVAEWDKWQEENDVEPIFTETTFWSEQYGYAGTVRRKSYFWYYWISVSAKGHCAYSAIICSVTYFKLFPVRFVIRIRKVIN